MNSIIFAEKQNTMQIETLLAKYKRKLVLQRYSKSSIFNYKSAVKNFLQIAIGILPIASQNQLILRNSMLFRAFG